MTEKEILPTFLGIGGQKCGTTWLHHYLAAHPDAFVPTKQKELCFFDARYKKYGRNGYLSFFKDAQAQKAVGEITPTYLWVSRRHSEWGAPNTFRNEVPERVMDFLGPDLKIVVLLRNPIQRAISAFLHNTKMKRVPMDAPIRPWLDKFGIVHMGFWGAHLARWTEVYSRDNFFVATYEDLFEKPETLVSLLNFIGLEPVDALKNKNSDKYQLSFPYRRDGDEFLHGDGRLIASEKDTQFIRDLYRPDVSLLKESWGLPADLWSQDFQSATQPLLGAPPHDLDDCKPGSPPYAPSWQTGDAQPLLSRAVSRRATALSTAASLSRPKTRMRTVENHSPTSHCSVAPAAVCRPCALEPNS